MSRESRAAIVGVLFVVSGALGLTYQVVWFKYLALFLGNTTYAQTVVLATFMGGLAIGSALWGPTADRRRRPLALYGWLEIAIALFCLLYPVLMGVVRGGFTSFVLWAGWESGGFNVLLLKVVVSLLTLLPPTILMGGTLPILVRALSRSLEDSGRTVASLYFLNSFGAVMGALLAGFFFIRILGLEMTIIFSAILNLAVGFAAVVVGRDAAGEKSEALPDVEASPGERGYFDDRQVTLAIVVAACSGIASMIYEVSWVRMLIPVLGSSTYSFSLMLVAFISGITIGSYLIAHRIGRLQNLVVWLAGTQAGVAIAMLAVLPVFGWVPYVFWNVAHMLARSDSTYPVFLVLQFGFGFLLLLVPTIFMGMGLPIATRIAARSLRRLGGSVGRVFAVNTVGAVVGALGAGLILFPAIGVQKTLLVGVVINTLAAVGVLIGDRTGMSRRRTIFALIVGSAVAGGILLMPSWNQSTMLTGVFRLINKNIPPPATYAEFVEKYEQVPVLYYKEGTTATVGVISAPSAEGLQNVLIINGKADASSKGDLPTQVLLAQLPALFHPDPKNALVIGYGSGVTAGSLLKHPLERVECVEISPEVVEAAEQFSHVNHKPLTDPRMALHIDDALAFLQVTPRMYDIVVSEPSNPWIAGIGSLYTKEFFEQCRQRMTANGLMVQWFHLYEIDMEMFTLVLRTFASSFPHVTLWAPMSADVILIGSNTPLDVTAEGLAKRFALPAVAGELSRIHIPDPMTLLSLQVMSNASVRVYAGEGALNTEDHPRLEYGAPRAFFVNRGIVGLDENDERLRHPRPETYLMRRLRRAPMSDGELRNAGIFHSSPMRGNPLLAYVFLSEYVRRRPRDPEPLSALAGVAARIRKTDESLGLNRRLTEISPDDPAILERFAWQKFENDSRTMSSMDTLDTRESEKLLRRAIALSMDTVDLYRVRLADVFYTTKRFKSAIDQYRRALAIRESHQADPYIPHDQVLLRLALSFYQIGDAQRSAGYALQATWANSRNQEARDLIYHIWSNGGSVPDSAAAAAAAR